jgi:predicted GIY-YIG superfamily endonuclease
MKYVYLIQSLENSYYKIGISKHPKKRVEQLQTGNASELRLVLTYQSEYANKIEKTLQRRYSHLRREGEWFDMGISHEVSFLKECQQIEETLVFLKKNSSVFI